MPSSAADSSKTFKGFSMSMRIVDERELYPLQKAVIGAAVCIYVVIASIVRTPLPRPREQWLIFVYPLVKMTPQVTAFSFLCLYNSRIFVILAVICWITPQYDTMMYVLILTNVSETFRSDQITSFLHTPMFVCQTRMM